MRTTAVLLGITVSTLLCAEEGAAFEIKRRDPVETLLSYQKDFFDKPVDKQNVDDLNEAMRAFVKAVVDETTTEHLEHPVENSESNARKLKLSDEERKYCQRPFCGVHTRSDGNVFSEQRSEMADQHLTFDLGNLRIVYKHPHSEGDHGGGSMKFLMIHGWQFGPTFGSGYEFLHFTERDTSTCLIKRTPVVIRGGVMRFLGKYWKLDGRKTTIFMYDDASIEKVVVE